VWVGGTGPSALALAGRLGDAWNGWGRTPEEVAAGLAEARRAAEAAGRDPAAVAATWGGQVLVAPDGREAEARLAAWGGDRPPAEVARVLAGDPEAVLARLRALAGAGASWCVLAPVGGPGAEARALLAAAAGLPAAPERVDGRRASHDRRRSGAAVQLASALGALCQICVNGPRHPG
jgi:alkanesulfonate monooxygenase SsuD/methylene tetrahydromethanopterin reductase-like flavin-dependent oxidoreductase (luciferase family)